MLIRVHLWFYSYLRAIGVSLISSNRISSFTDTNARFRHTPSTGSVPGAVNVPQRSPVMVMRSIVLPEQMYAVP